jgi:hypothetical protein
MKVVYIYGFQGMFVGNSEYDYVEPAIGDVHKCMVFIAQDIDELDFDRALIEVKKYGFDQVINLSGNTLKVEVLNTDAYKGFTGFYTEALEEGSSLVYYPNT